MPYHPRNVFAAANEASPRVLIAPQRYIQGPGVIDRMPKYLEFLAAKRAAILASKRGLTAEGARLAESLHAAGIETVAARFNGEASLQEVEAQVAALADQRLDCLIAVGGGKAVDTGKSVAHRLEVPVVIVPTLASNDAPCSALSVLYTPAGVSDIVEFYPRSPALVVVDTDVVADAGERFLVAGMGDAMATWYETRACLQNKAAVTPLGARPTLAACALGEVCARTLYEHGEAAASSVAASRNDEAVEKVVEANTLLSGIGFESGGLAVAHAMALAYTRLEVVHSNYLHGEMVAMGLLAQLCLEETSDRQRAAGFFARVGLPVHLGQLSLAPAQSQALDTLVEATMQNPMVHHMPVPVNEEALRQATLDAHDLGLAVARDQGDAAYRRLHS